MKQILLFLAFATAVVAGCKKNDDSASPQPSTPKPEFFTFKIKGDSFNNEVFKIEKGGVNRSFCYETTAGLRFGIINDSTSFTLAHFGINAARTGKFAMDNHNGGSLDLQGAKNYASIFTETGEIVITQYPNSTSDYVTGTFKGVFGQILGLESDSLIITEGSFCIKRSL